MRTGQDVLKDFEKINYTLNKNDEYTLSITRENKIIHIVKPTKSYKKYDRKTFLSLSFEMQEHKLLNELFQIWGWI